jgi:oxygen-independent coproporphyrinogen-3 oxidase
VRRGNVTDVEEYINRIFAHKPVVAEQETTNRQQSMFETMMLGLRLIEGVNRQEFAARYGTDTVNEYADVLTRLESRKLLTVYEDRICLTSQGLLFSNEAIGEFLV